MVLNFIKKKMNFYSLLLTTNNALFLLAILGIVLNRKNILVLLMSFELLFLSIHLNFIVFSVFLDDFFGQLFSLFILTISGCESALGLSILVVYYNLRKSIAVENFQMLRG